MWQTVLALRQGGGVRNYGQAPIVPGSGTGTGQLAYQSAPPVAKSAVSSKPPVAPKPVGKGGARDGAGRKGGYKVPYAPRPRKPPVVSHEIGVSLQQYGTIDSVDAQMATLKATRRLLSQGRTRDNVQILAAPGSLGANPVGKRSDQTEVTAAEVSASTNLIGTSSESPDPRTVETAKYSAATTSAAAVAPEAMGLSVANQGGGAAVPTSQTPAQSVQLADDRQLPVKLQPIQEVEGDVALPTKSLFRQKK